MEGYMPIGIQSYRSWPLRLGFEEETDSRIGATDLGMRDIIG
jgi:hypothetical protein